MEGHCSTGQNPQWAVVPMEEEEKQPTRCNKFRLLIFLNQLCIYSFYYNTPILLPTGGKVEMEHLNLVTGRQQYRPIVPKAVYTVKKCS